MSRLSPKPLRRFSASTTTLPRCVEVGMWIWTSSSLTLRSWATSASKFCRRAFCLVWRPLGFWRTQSSSAAIVRWRAFSVFSSCARRFCFCSSQLE